MESSWGRGIEFGAWERRMDLKDIKCEVVVMDPGKLVAVLMIISRMSIVSLSKPKAVGMGIMAPFPLFKLKAVGGLGAQPPHC